VRGVAAGGEEAIITDNGTEIAAIIPIGKLRRLESGDDGARGTAFVQRFNESRNIRTTDDGLAAMRARLEQFEAARRDKRADAA
jgi:antitoxin (DNA-binding transcriptional repressor) of toxin-antitoxin stability system